VSENKCCLDDKPCPIHHASFIQPPGQQRRLAAGHSFPLGSSASSTGVNFSIFSTCDQLELLLFDTPESPLPSSILTLDPKKNKTFHYWHIFVPDLHPGQVYAYRAYGPHDPQHGLRFDARKVLLDPYTRAIANISNYSREAASGLENNCAFALRSVVADTSYDWEDDQPLSIPYSQTVIYELHVGGFTKSPSSGLPPHQRGTFSGVKQKIDYLKTLGITAVELLPVNQFDQHDAPPGLSNYWGYSPIAFFAPHAQYSSAKEPLAVLDEFRDMVKALHQAGIEVILDVVFNHTAEGNEHGPTLSFRGLDNSAYYILDPTDPSRYANFTGCGNTFKGSSSVAQRLILDCLRYWVSEMHVDGFRFDLASTLSRDITGKPQPVELSPILSTIESDPILAGTKLIAEAWDAAGHYQIGSFVNKCYWFAEWNGPFRDDLRRFLKGDRASAHAAARRIAGSSDLYSHRDREPNRSINFVTCHDGFTLNDLVSYNDKHNNANAENNQDGASFNFSWNCGEEGTSDDPQVERLRIRQIKNFLTFLFVAQGTPMLLMGDEARRSQQGNNNTYCHDSPIAWFDWHLLHNNSELLDFTKSLIAFTQSQSLFKQEHLLCTMQHPCNCPRIEWHGVRLNSPDWCDDSHTLAFTLHDPDSRRQLHVIFNAYWHPLQFQLPPLPMGKHWHRIIDTSLPDNKSFQQPATAPKHLLSTYQVLDRSAVLLMS
jgi:glycogen operon protein